jgi:hypothetical protein
MSSSKISRLQPVTVVFHISTKSTFEGAMCASSSCQICLGMHLCSEVEEREEEVSGWQEDVQLSIEQGQDGLEADGDVYLRHEPDATRRRPLWIVGGYRRILKASLESGSRTANSPYLRIDWCAKSKVMVGSWASERLPYCHLGRRRTFQVMMRMGPGLKCKGKTAWKLTVNAET